MKNHISRNHNEEAHSYRNITDKSILNGMRIMINTSSISLLGNGFVVNDHYTCPDYYRLIIHDVSSDTNILDVAYRTMSEVLTALEVNPRLYENGNYEIHAYAKADGHLHCIAYRTKVDTINAALRELKPFARMVEAYRKFNFLTIQSN